jgi:hypothetical protein
MRPESAKAAAARVGIRGRGPGSGSGVGVRGWGPGSASGSGSGVGVGGRRRGRGSGSGSRVGVGVPGWGRGPRSGSRSESASGFGVGFGVACLAREESHVCGAAPEPVRFQTIRTNRTRRISKILGRVNLVRPGPDQTGTPEDLAAVWRVESLHQLGVTEEFQRLREYEANRAQFGSDWVRAAHSSTTNLRLTPADLTDLCEELICQTVSGLTDLCEEPIGQSVSGLTDLCEEPIGQSVSGLGDQVWYVAQSWRAVHVGSPSAPASRPRASCSC